MKIGFKLTLLIIVFLAFVLRFYRVTEVPPSLNWDEVSIGYNAYSIMKTGKDEWGKSFPLHFKAYGEYKLPTQIYFSIPGIYFFGLTDLGIRILPVVYGTLTVLILYFLCKEWFESEFVALTASFLLAISPWHIQLTRASFESSFSVFWILLGLWFLLKGFKKQIWWILSMVPFAISVYTYNSARVFTPLFLFVLLFIYRKVFLKHKKYVVYSLITFFVLMIPLMPFFFSSDRNSRYKLVSITDDPGLIPRIDQNRNNSNLPQPLPRLVHNRVTYVSLYLTEHYLAHFTPDFLFVNGAPHKQHHVQDVGEMYFFQFPLVLLGLYSLFKLNKKYRGLWSAWVLLAFIPVSITNDSIPHALRTVIANPAYQIVSALGFFELIKYFKKRSNYYLFLLLVILIVSISIISYLNNLFNIYPKKYSYDWQYGNKQAVEYIKQNYSKYDQIVFTRHYGEPQMFTLFYLTYDPAQYFNNSKLERFETYDWVRVLHFDKFYFPDLGDRGTRYEDIIKQFPNQRLLFIGKAGDFPKDVKRLEEIKFLDNSTAFEIVEKVP